jgi:hypothetical protein
MSRPLSLLLITVLISPLAACSNAPWAKDFERTVAPDPQLLIGDRPQSPSTGTPGNGAGTGQEGDRSNSGIISNNDGTNGRTDGQSEKGDRPPQPGDANFIGPVLPGTDPSGVATTVETANRSFTDLTQAPTELRPYVIDLANLGVLTLRPIDQNDQSQNNQSQNNQNQTNQKSEQKPAIPTSSVATSVDPLNQFKPQQTVSRRQYARWLVATNNRLYANQSARQIRLAVTNDTPAFQDVPKSDPDFAAIQGLANAGLIPSAIAGNSTAVTFRPDASLTREDLILWKVPVDMRRSLPTATLEAVEQTWGFQDTAKIEPRALRAVLADYQNSDFANIRRAFGYTTLFNPKKTVTRAEAAAVLWYFGYQDEGVSAKQVLRSPGSTSPSSPSTDGSTNRSTDGSTNSSTDGSTNRSTSTLTPVPSATP